MPRVKSVTYDIEGECIQVNYNVSTSGFFSSNIPSSVSEKLGVDKRLEGKTLMDVEGIINEAYKKFKDRKTSLSLKIAITFGVSGEMVKYANGTLNNKFFDSKYKRGHSFDTLKSTVGLDFRVLIEEDVDGRLYYHDTEVPHLEMKVAQWKKVVDSYVSTSTTSIKDQEILLDYSNQTLVNLYSITEQLRKAAIFLVNLFSDPEIALKLREPQQKLL